MSDDRIAELAAVLSTRLVNSTEAERLRFDFDLKNCSCYCARTAKDVLQPSLLPLDEHQVEFVIIITERMDRFTESDKLSFCLSMMHCQCSWARTMKELLWPRVVDQAMAAGIFQVQKK
jgi:hypothetical protein